MSNNLQSSISKHSEQQRKIYMPLNQNHFVSTVDKEILHESQILKKIKNKIQNFKEKQKSRNKIKNSFNYSHHCFSSTKLQNKKNENIRMVRTATSTPFRDMANTLRACSPAFPIRTANKDKIGSLSFQVTKTPSECQN